MSHFLLDCFDNSAALIYPWLLEYADHSDGYNASPFAKSYGQKNQSNTANLGVFSRNL